jgi:hypothetical protein
MPSVSRFPVRFLLAALLAGLFFSFYLPGKKKKPDPFLYAYTRGDGSGGLHLLWSDDGKKWQPIKGGKPVVKPGVGDYVMLQPHLSQTPDGIFHLVWATGKNRREIGYARSENLEEWSVQRLIRVMEKDTFVLNVSSPELWYDAENQRVMLHWSSTVPGRFKETDKQYDTLPGGLSFNHRLYRKFSSDLKEWGPTELFFDPGFSARDGSLAADSGKIMLFFKDNTQKEKNIQNNIKMSTSASATGGFNPKSTLISRGTWAEGPAAIRIDSHFVAYFYKYRTRKMGAFATKNFSKWFDFSDSLSFPKGVEAGSVLRIPEKLMRKLKEE